MDVTSLLNSSSLGFNKEKACSDQTPKSSTTEDTTSPPDAATPTSEDALCRRSHDYKVTSRSRTPWDAGGYALPLLETKTAHIPAKSVKISSSMSPTSPKHKSSNSSSSVSSYAPSLNSTSHSRISSRSTVNECPGVTAGPDILPLELGSENKDQILLADLSRVSKHDREVLPSARGGESASPGLGRPRSPSDAMLISRARQSSDRISLYGTVPENFEIARDYSIPPLSKLHKRIVSAPNFASISSLDRTFPPLPTTLQPTPPPSHQGDRRPSYVMEASSSSPVADSPAAQQNEVKCMYTAVCDTGSQPRKAISHIFGRNKLCTRMIPSHVWVHFCRKHYQRSRYRNAQEYAKVQCELVQRQVRRIQAWSDENKRSGQGGVVVDWSLSMRKREQNRVQEMSHRRHTSGQDSDEEDELDRAILNGTAVPDWLRAKVGDGYSTTEIEQMLERLADEVQKNNMTQIPDIEILPNITDIQDGSRNRVTLKRKASISSTHRRSQSVGDSLRPTLQPVSRRVARPNVGRSEDILQSPPPVKRQRISHDISSPNERPEYILRQPSERTLPPATTRQPTSLHQHSVSAGNRDHVDTYTGVNTRDRHHFGGPLLPSPTLQRSIHTYPSSHGQESFSESQDYFDARRPSHMRTHSESYHDFNYPSYHSSSEYQSYQNYDPSPSTYERNYMMPTINSSAPPTSHYGYYNQHPPSIPPMRSHENPSFWSSPVPGRSSSNSHRHGRHQSSPGVHQQMPRSSAPEYRSLSSPTLSTGGYEHPTYNRQQDPLASQHHPAYRPIVEESDKTKALYAERR